MTSKSIYFCVYRITNLVENKHYYGYKSSKIHPSKVIGINYFSSSKDKEFIKDQKINPENYKYKIVQIFKSKDCAITREIKLHKKFNVGNNSKFYNKVKQTSVNFDASGTTTVKDEFGVYTRVSCKDTRFLSGELVGSTKGKVLVKDNFGDNFFIDEYDPRFLNGELSGVTKGMVTMLNKNTNKAEYVPINDPRILFGELVGLTKNKIVVKDKNTGEIMQMDTTDCRIKTGNFVGIRHGFLTVREVLTGKTCSKSLMDEEYLTGKYVHHRIKFIDAKTKDGTIIKVNIFDNRIYTGEIEYVPKVKR